MWLQLWAIAAEKQDGEQMGTRWRHVDGDTMGARWGQDGDKMGTRWLMGAPKRVQLGLSWDQAWGSGPSDTMPAPVGRT